MTNYTYTRTCSFILSMALTLNVFAGRESIPATVGDIDLTPPEVVDAIVDICGGDDDGILFESNGKYYPVDGICAWLNQIGEIAFESQYASGTLWGILDDKCDGKIWAEAEAVSTQNLNVDFESYYNEMKYTTTMTDLSWDFGDGNTSTSNDPTHVYQESGTYQVCLTVNGNDVHSGSVTEMYCFDVTVSSGSSSPEVDANFSNTKDLYPPTLILTKTYGGHMLRIDLSVDAATMFQVVALDGKVVMDYTEYLTAGIQDVYIPSTDLGTALYIVNVKINDYEETLKMLNLR